MLRIVLSRAALFPWMGIASMAAGALFPDGNTAGIVLIVIGANVAFYSLRDFSQNFAWGADSRAMLTLCAVAFLLGLALLASATQLEGFHHWLALICTGLYLCIFAVWTIQQPVSWAYRIPAVVGSLLMVLGGIFGHLGWKDWRVFSESEEVPQEITLSDLQRNGFGSNRYVRLKEFRFCDRFAAEKPDKDSKINDVVIPVVAVDGQAVRKGGPVPGVPARIEAVALYLSLGAPNIGGPRIGARGPFDVLRKKWEEGYECTVVTGIKQIKPEVRQQLSEWAPQTDFSQVIVLDWRKPGSASRVYGCLAGGAAGLLLGLLALAIVYVRAWKVVSSADWQAPVEAATEESAAPEQG